MYHDFRIGFCISGTGRLFRAAANHKDQLQIEPALVVAETKVADDVEPFCATHKIPLFRLPSHKRRQEFDEQLTQICTAAKLDLLCLTFDKIVPVELVNYYCGRIINVHMGLLPAFPGRLGIEQALNAHVRFAGATIHEVDETVDTGAIIAQCVVGVHKNDTPESFGKRLFGPLSLMHLQVLAWYAEGRVTKDGQGNIWVRDAFYGEFPISPTVELSFPD